MMLNWKESVLGHHARVRVTDRGNERSIATVDARVLGSTLRVAGHGTGWQHLTVSLPDSILHVPVEHPSTTLAMQRFEAYLARAQNAGLWTIEEVSL